VIVENWGCTEYHSIKHCVGLLIQSAGLSSTSPEEKPIVVDYFGGQQSVFLLALFFWRFPRYFLVPMFGRSIIMKIDSQRPFLKESMHKLNRASEDLAGGAKMKNTAFPL